MGLETYARAHKHTFQRQTCHFYYRGADKSLARPGRKQGTRQKILIFIYPIYNHNWRNIITIYIYNKTSIKRNTGVLISP